jgi:hypothetical protein
MRRDLAIHPPLEQSHRTINTAAVPTLDALAAASQLEGHNNLLRL